MCERPENRERGFTLVELLAALALSLIILTALSATFVFQSRTYDAQEQAAQMVQTARAAMDMVTREVRMAGYNPRGVTFDGIALDNTALRIRADLNGDGDTNDANEYVVYTYDNANERINRQYWVFAMAVSQPFAENISNASVTYLDGTGSAAASSAAIRQVLISITARTEKPDPNYPPNNGYRTYTLTSLITPLNLDF